MRVFEDEEFDDFDDRDSRAWFTDLEFRRCTFVGATFTITDDPRLRSHVRNAKLTDCYAMGCQVATSTFEEVVVDGLRVNVDTFIRGCAYRHVILKGRIVGKLCLTERGLGSMLPKAELQRIKQ